MQIHGGGIRVEARLHIPLTSEQGAPFVIVACRHGDEGVFDLYLDVDEVEQLHAELDRCLKEWPETTEGGVSSRIS